MILPPLSWAWACTKYMSFFTSANIQMAGGGCCATVGYRAAITQFPTLCVPFPIALTPGYTLKPVPLCQTAGRKWIPFWALSHFARLGSCFKALVSGSIGSKSHTRGTSIDVKGLTDPGSALWRTAPVYSWAGLCNDLVSQLSY